jgi:hypothetical protein
VELAGAHAEDGIEILVHNLCHADLLVILSGAGSDSASGADSRKARPLFNQYNFVSQVILGHLDALQAGGAKLVPIGAQNCSGEVQPIGISLTSDEVVGGAAIVDRGQGAAGGGMEGAAISNPWERFHLKGVKRHDRRPESFKRLKIHPSGTEPSRDEQGDEAPMHDVRINAVVLPLVATLIPEWVSRGCDSAHTPTCGHGPPRAHSGRSHPAHRSARLPCRVTTDPMADPRRRARWSGCGRSASAGQPPVGHVSQRRFWCW